MVKMELMHKNANKKKKTCSMELKKKPHQNEHSGL